MKLSRSSWKLPVACGVALLAIWRFGAPTIVPAAPPSSPAPATAAKPNPAAEIAKLKTPDALFDYINQHATIDDIQPDEALTREEQMAQVRALVADKIAALRPAIDRFLEEYPQDPRHFEVALDRALFLKGAENISDADVSKTLHDVAANPAAPFNARHRARNVLLRNTVEEVDPRAGLTPALEKEFSDYERDFPDDESGGDLVRLRLQLVRATAPDKLVGVLESLTKSPNKATAAAAQEQYALLTQPVELKFDSATDGQPVDLAKLRGKVVLLDFWATWCPGCLQVMPEIKGLNAKYDHKDFQIVGISFDQDKAAMLKLVKAKKLDWPQYCDGKGMESAVAARFGLTEIPAAWLLDRQGFAHRIDLQQQDLDAEIGKLVDAKL